MISVPMVSPPTVKSDPTSATPAPPGDGEDQFLEALLAFFGDGPMAAPTSTPAVDAQAAAADGESEDSGEPARDEGSGGDRRTTCLVGTGMPMPTMSGAMDAGATGVVANDDPTPNDGAPQGDPAPDPATASPVAPSAPRSGMTTDAPSSARLHATVAPAGMASATDAGAAIAMEAARAGEPPVAFVRAPEADAPRASAPPGIEKHSAVLDRAPASGESPGAEAAPSTDGLPTTAQHAATVTGPEDEIAPPRVQPPMSARATQPTRQPPAPNAKLGSYEGALATTTGDALVTPASVPAADANRAPVAPDTAAMPPRSGDRPGVSKGSDSVQLGDVQAAGGSALANDTGPLRPKATGTTTDDGKKGEPGHVRDPASAVIGATHPAKFAGSAPDGTRPPEVVDGTTVKAPANVAPVPEGDRSLTDSGDGPRHGTPHAPPSHTPATGGPASAATHQPAPVPTSRPEITAPVGVPSPVAADRLTEVLAGEIRRATPNGEHRLELTLHPPELGRVELSMVVGQEAIHAHLVAHTEGARDLLSHHLAGLREQLISQGFADPQLSVDLRHGSGERNWQRPDGGARTMPRDEAAPSVPRSTVAESRRSDPRSFHRIA